MHHNTAAVSLVAIEEAFFFDVGSLYEHLENLTDRRDPRGLPYPLAVALVFIILAKLAGEQEPRGERQTGGRATTVRDRRQALDRERVAL